MDVERVAQLAGEFLAALVTEVRQYDLRAFVGEDTRAFLAHAADRSRDDRHLARQTQIHSDPLYLLVIAECRVAPAERRDARGRV